MVSRVRFVSSGLDTSRLGLGASRLHYLRSQRERNALILGAVDLGVTHFDTARLYGDGLSERALGAALGGRRGEVTLATKFGLLPNRAIEFIPALAAPLRAARSVARRLKLLSGPRRCWEPLVMEASLESSLRALGTDYLDVLFLHDARHDEIAGRDDLIAALLRARQSGKTRFLGLAGAFGEVKAVANAFRGVFDIVQTPENAWTDELVPDFTFGALTKGPQYFNAAGPSTGDVRSGIVRALARRPNGAVLVGTSKLEHLRQLAEAVETGP